MCTSLFPLLAMMKKSRLLWLMSLVPPLCVTTWTTPKRLESKAFLIFYLCTMWVKSLETLNFLVPEQCCISCTLYTSSSSSVDHWKGRGIHRDLLPNTTIRHRTLNPVLKSFHNHGEENENVKKAIGWLGKNNNSARASRLFCRFLYRHCTTASGKWLISRFMKDITKRRLNNLSLSEVEYVSLQFSSKRVRLHLTKLESWSNRDRD